MEANISIFYKLEFGYLVVSEAKVKNLGLWGALPGYTILSPNATLSELEEVIWKHLDISLKTKDVEREVVNQNKYWVKAGYRSYGPFSKNFKLVQLSLNGDGVEIQKWQTATKGFEPSREEGSTTLLALSSIDKSTTFLAQVVRGYLTKDSSFVSDELVFRTLNEIQVSFTEPNLNLFENRGDGHSDLYQLYVHQEYEGTYLAFSIDSGYESFGEREMKQSFETYYGSLRAYDYQTYENMPFRFKVIAQTDSLQIVSHLFADGDDLLEVIYVIDLQAPETDIETIRQEFESVIQSIKIS